MTAAALGFGSKLAWKQTFDLADVRTRIDGAGGKPGTGSGTTRPRGRQQDPPPRPEPATPQAREVERPAPRYHRPAPFLLAVRGARPSPRHHGDGLYADNGLLACRYPGAAVPSYDGVVDGATVLPTLGSGAIPEEVTTVVREAVLLDPYGFRWLAAASAPPSGSVKQVEARLAAEVVRLYGTDGTFDGSAHVELAPDAAARRTTSASSWSGHTVSEVAARTQVAAELARFSVVRGTPPSPVAHTTWRQPWVPLWLEWRVRLDGEPTLRGWHLEGFDLQPDGTATPGAGSFSTTLTGRSELGQGLADSLQAALKDWLGSELQRQASAGRDSFGDATVLQRLGELRAPLDLVSASLDGIREQLLGIDFVGVVARELGARPGASGVPTPLFGGTMRFEELRIVDAFGRTVSVPDTVLDTMRSTVELGVDGSPRLVTVRPRFQGSARWLWRLVDASAPSGTPPDGFAEAYVDQLDPASATRPVAGFLLPDHVDETLEVFGVDGEAIGELGHDPVTGAVTWEPAPGRPLPPDAAPPDGVPDASRLVAEVAAALVRADASARALDDATRPQHSALTEMLRAVDSTLWSVDTFGALGSSTVAGLVGRPIAVVRTTLTLDVPDDVAELDVTAPGGAEARRAAFDALADELVEVHLGTLARSDDALVGWFVGDDFEHLHLVDAALAEHARESGRQVGQLGLLGTDEQRGLPPQAHLEHPYLVTEGRLFVRPRRPVVLTLLMLPGGKAHVTSGVLPRKDLELADSWVAPGLTKVMPSVRVGPVLVDPAEIRLPLVSTLGDKQTFTRRTGELTWRDDPILAATQTAYLPRLPHEAQEGWIRVTPTPEPGTGGTAGGNVMSRAAKRGRARQRQRHATARAGEFDLAALRSAAMPLMAFADSDVRRWVPIGPAVVRRGQAGGRPRVSGRVRDLAVSDDGRRVYAASAMGGLWYSGNAGSTWDPVGGWAERAAVRGGINNAQSCGALLVRFGATAADDFVLLGTGEPTPSVSPMGETSFGGVGVLAAAHPATAGVEANPWEAEAGIALLEGAGVYRLKAKPPAGGASPPPGAPAEVLAATTAGLVHGRRTHVGPAAPGGHDEYRWTKLPSIDQLVFGAAVPPAGQSTPEVTDVLWLPGGVVVVAIRSRGVAVSHDDAGSFAWVVNCNNPVSNIGLIGRMSLELAPGSNRLYVLGEIRRPAPANPRNLPVLFRVADITVPPTAVAPSADRVGGLDPQIWPGQRDYDQALAVTVSAAGADRVYVGGSFFDVSTDPTGGNIGASLWCFDVAAAPAGSAAPGHALGPARRARASPGAAPRRHRRHHPSRRGRGRAPTSPA